MATAHNPENKQQQREGNNLGQISEKAPKAHMNCLREWLRDEREDQQHTFEPNEFAYRQGRIEAFELAIELLEGRILESDGN